MIDLTEITISLLSGIDDNRPVNLTQLISSLKQTQQKDGSKLTDQYQLLDWLNDFATEAEILKGIDQLIDQAKTNHTLKNRYQTIERLAKLGAQVELTKVINQAILKPGQSLMYPRNISMILKLKSTKQLYPITHGDLINRLKTLNYAASHTK